jgi:hypothetical protein
MAEPQSTAAEALTLQLAVNEMIHAEHGVDARFLQLAELDPFKAITNYTTPTVGGVSYNLFTVNVQPGQCLVLTYIKAWLSRSSASTPTDPDLVEFTEPILSDTAFLGTRVNSVNTQQTQAAGIEMYVNTPILYAWPSGATTLMRVTSGTAALWSGITTNGYVVKLRWSGFFLPGAYFNAVQKIQTQFISSN